MFLILTIWQIGSIYLTHRISDEWATGQETCAYVGKKHIMYSLDGLIQHAKTRIAYK